MSTAQHPIAAASTPRTRLGRIAYRNVAPIYHPLEAGWLPHDCEMVAGTPAQCNQRLRDCELDISAVSSIEYARSPERYLLLPGLAIASFGPVGSVLLFSSVPVEELRDASILVTAATHTSAALLQLLLAERFGACPPLVPAAGGIRTAVANGTCPAAALAIGDEALDLAHNPCFPYALDLGAMWREATGLPFVFGVWAARKEWAQAHQEEAVRVARLLCQARDMGLARLDEIIQACIVDEHCDESSLAAYFAGLRLILGEAEHTGLERFFDLLGESGLAPKVPAMEFLDTSQGEMLQALHG